MYVSHTSVCEAGPKVAETSKLAAESMLSWLRDFDGYQGMVIVADAESGTARFMTFWDSLDSAQRSEKGRQQVRESMIAAAGAKLDSVQLFEVVLDHRPGADGTG